MEEWNDRINGWREQLASWQTQFEAEYQKLARKRRGWFRKLSVGELEEIAGLARKAAGDGQASESFRLISELCDAYLGEALPQNRAKVRAWIGAEALTTNAVWSYALQSIEMLPRQANEFTLRRALAAISIVDLRVDYNAFLAALGRLWIAARKAGLDPKPHFESVAKLSNPGMGGGGACVGEQLADFSASAYFRDHVRPLLPRAA
jgi:hypothetical protein